MAATEIAQYQLLEWDSQFFGFGVAKLLFPSVDAETLTAALMQLKKQNIRLVYWPAPVPDESSKSAAQACFGRMVGCHVTFQHTTNESTPKSIGELVEYDDTDANTDLIELALESGKFSRYATDPQIGRKKFEEFFATWIRKCARRQMANHILLSKKNGQTQGMICIQASAPDSRLVLMAVGADVRTVGVGTSLVQGALALGNQKGCISNSIVTYGENIAACKLFEKCGFSEFERRDFYHFWL